MDRKEWYSTDTSGGQALVIEEGTGRNVAVAYEAADAPLLAEAPAMLAALRGIMDGGSWQDDGSFVYYPPTDCPDDEGSIGECGAILARIDATPTAQPAGDDPAITAAANLSRAALVEAAGEALALQAPISEAEPVQTFTAFCQEADGTGTIWIQQVKAETIADATAAARRDCAEDWGFDVEQVHCLGLARGDCQIVHWEDAAP